MTLSYVLARQTDEDHFYIRSFSNYIIANVRPDKRIDWYIDPKNGDAITGCNVMIKGQTTSVNTQECGEFGILIR